MSDEQPPKRNSKAKKRAADKEDAEAKRRRRIPTKSELQQLQKLYKTDEKIGERLGGVPAYLVAYWRRKKGIPRYNLPKFSESEIRNLWERFGDDEKAGLELGISKAAFYNWRRRYGIKEKPAFLKLEQLEFPFAGAAPSVGSNTLYGKRTVAQKVFARLLQTQTVPVGETVSVEPDWALVGRSAAEVLGKFRELNSEYVWNPNKIIITGGGVSSIGGHPSANDRRKVAEFARRQGIRSIYSVLSGAPYQLALENGHLLPGQLLVSCDMSPTVGGTMAGLAARVSTEEVARLWAEGTIALPVPPTILVTISGRRPRGLFATDVMYETLRQLRNAAVDGHALEFTGGMIAQLTVPERITLASLASETGAVGATLPYDAAVRRFLVHRHPGKLTPLLPDKDAEYAGLYQVNVDQFVPILAGPNGCEQIRPVAEFEDAAISQVVIGSVGGGRFENLRIAADVLKGKEIDPEVQLFVIPDSRQVFLEALKKGLIRVFIEAGGTVLPPGCDANAIRRIALADTERALVTGDTTLAKELAGEKGECYVCSAATAAVSALNGVITDPSRYVR